MTDLGIDVGIDNPTEPETCAKKRDRTSTQLLGLEPESSGNTTNSRESSKTQCQELPENTASGQANRDSKSLVSSRVIDPPGKPSLTIDYTPPDAATHLAVIISAWDAWCAALSDDAGRFDEDVAHGRLCSAIEVARKAVTR